jgi:hypothetical protein
MFPTERRRGDCGNAINSDGSGNSRGNYASRPSRSESLRRKMIGKPDSGKPTVRFDEGELEIEPKVTTPVLYSTAADILKSIRTEVRVFHLSLYHFYSISFEGLNF